ncbi:NLI interacting factor-like phosphatase [Variovorax sp. YR750]|uniref:NIF family HAD-type phosphatase n=1 Tax=Variovorax sp. YR750 TaxID=1884384 RepID=UPI0008BB1ADA|nr:NIF family HAD-type phosphatase [Variovorax sp. YR750]SEK98958.1 NLI interacting factor-like phosphatase [Variovorax sp. YR750]
MNSYVLALDLEGTLISNAMSQIPRPGLAEFLTRCAELFPRIVMFTTVKEERFRKIARLLVDEKVAPTWFADMEYITWQGETKDLQFVPGVDPHQVLLVDDFEKYVHPGQETQWLQVEHFDYPYSSEDRGLAEVFDALAARIAR